MLALAGSRSTAFFDIANNAFCECCYPVLFARASLKLRLLVLSFRFSLRCRAGFEALLLSRAFCAGLIEARRLDVPAV